MKRYIIAALLGTSLLLGANAALQKHDAVKTANAQLTKDLEAQKEETIKANSLAQELNAALQLERKLQSALQQQQNQLSDQLNQSKFLIARLEHENKELSDWAANDLPDAVKRLRDRPHITGADDYQDWLSSRNRLHAEPNQPSQ